jgi:5-methyltetrahydrofolate--homocysteine methyltransferase
MDMGIVNAGQLGVYDELDPELRERVEDVVLNRRDDATERLLEIADRFKGGGTKREENLAWRGTPSNRCRWRAPAHALVHGITTSSSRTPRKRARSRRAAAARSR